MVRKNSWETFLGADPYPQEPLVPFSISGLSIPIAGNEDEFKQRARLMAYQQLLYRMFGSSFECAPIAGGFSGSSVVKITPFDALGNREEAVIVKLDSASNIKIEVANSIQAQAALGDIAARVLGEPIYIQSDMDGMEYGGFKVELAGAVLQVPELSAPGSQSPMINTFKDLVIFECEEAVLAKVLMKTSTSTESIRLHIQDESGDDDPTDFPDLSRKLESEIKRPYGAVLTIIKELFGLDGSATRSLRRFEGGATTSTRRRISNSDPNHPAGGDFLLSRLPSDLSESSQVEQVLTLLMLSPEHVSPYTQVNGALSAVRSALARAPVEWRLLRGFSHGDLNGSNIIIDAMEGMWLVDFATARKLPLTADLAKLETCIVFEYAFIPIPVEVFLRMSHVVDSGTLGCWMRVSGEALDEFLARASSVRSWSSENQLDEILSRMEDVASSRRLRARLVVNRSIFANCLEFVKNRILPCLVPRSVDGNVFRSLVDMAETRRELSVLLPPALQAFSVSLQAAEKMRHYCMSDLEKLFTQISCEESGVFNWDVSPIEFSVMLLRESARIVRYTDIPPWTKLVVGEFAQALSDLICSEVDRLTGLLPIDFVPVIVGMSRTSTPTDSDEAEEDIFSDSPRAGGLGGSNPGQHSTLSSPSMAEEAKKYSKFLKTKYGFLIDFVSGRQLDVLSQCCDLRLQIGSSITSSDRLLETSLGSSFLVSGIPGSGKSYLLRRLLVDALATASVPIYLNVTDWAKHLAEEVSSGCCLESYLRTQFVDDDSRLDFLRSCLRKRRALLLVDGLDDSSGEVLRRITSCITSKAQRGTVVVATCRQKPAEPLAFVHAEILCLDRDQRRQVVRNRLTAADVNGLSKFEAFFDSITLNDDGLAVGVNLLKSPAFLSMLLCYWSNTAGQSTPTGANSSPNLLRLAASSVVSRQITASEDLMLQRSISPATVGSSPCVVDVYRVAVSVLVHRYQVLQEPDRSKVRESARRLTELLRFIAFSMKCNRVDFCERADLGSVISEHICQGRFSLLSPSESGFRFCLSGILDVLAADHIIYASSEAGDKLTMENLVADDWWVSALSIVADKAPMKYVRLVERKLTAGFSRIISGDTCLHLAARAGHLPLFKILSRSALLESLIDRPNADSLLPLHEAARSASQSASQISRLLIASRADVWATTADGWCALHYAASFHNRDVCAALLEESRANRGSFCQLPRMPCQQLARLSSSGSLLAMRILSGEVTSASAFIDAAKHVFPELSYFRGRSDTTPDASASVQGLDPSEIEYRRTIGAMLSVFWIVGDQYEAFTSCQEEDKKLTRESWDHIRRWCVETVRLTTPEAVDAMLCLMAIHDLGKLKDFRNDLARDFKDHDAAMKFIMTTTPEVLPSLCRLSDSNQQAVRAALGLEFNFGQFLQAENLPVNLCAIKELSQATLAFYLFHILADMSGIMGAVTLEGSAFMTQTMYLNFSLGIEALSELSTAKSVEDVYEGFLRRRAVNQGLSSKFNREVVRLACLARTFDVCEGESVFTCWNTLDDSTRNSLQDHLARTGLKNRKLPAFLLYYAPAFMENAKHNPQIGLAGAMNFLNRIFLAAESEFKDCGMRSYVVIHMAEAAELAKRKQSLDHVCFRIVRSGGSRRLSEGTVRISSWYKSGTRLSEQLRSKSPPTTLDELKSSYPEFSFVPCNKSGSLLLNLLHSRFDSRCHSEMAAWIKACVPIDSLTDLYILCCLVELDSLDQLRVDLGLPLSTRVHEMIRSNESVFPSLANGNKEEILKVLAVPVLFEHFITTESIGVIAPLLPALSKRELVLYLALSLLNTKFLSDSFMGVFKFASGMILSLDHSDSVERYLRYRGDQQGLGTSFVSSPRNASMSSSDLNTLVRIGALCRIYVATGGCIVNEAIGSLNLSQRSQLADLFAQDRVIRSLSEFLCNCKSNSAVGLDSGLCVLLRVVSRCQSNSTILDLRKLAERAQRHSVILPFSDIAFEIIAGVVKPQILIPTRSDNTKLFSRIQTNVSNFTANLIAGISPESLTEELLRCYPEFDSFDLIETPGVATDVWSPDATVPADPPSTVAKSRTLSAVKSIVSVLVNVNESLSPASWSEIREWLTGQVLANPDAIDALMVYIIVRGLWKLSSIDIGLNASMFPSYSRLALKYRSLVDACLKCRFDFGQFLQGENRPESLCEIQSFVTCHGPFGLQFLLACNFSLQAAFLTDGSWLVFKTGKDAVGARPDRETCTMIYNKYLLRRGGMVLSGFRESPAEFTALCRLVCLARATSETEASALEIAFDDLQIERKSELTDHLTNCKTVVTYLPALIENLKLNSTIPPANRMDILLEVLRMARMTKRDVDVRNVASWAREVQILDALRLSIVDNRIIVTSSEQ